MLIRLLAGVFHSTITVLIVGFVILVGFAAATATAYGDPKHLMALAVIGVAFFVIVFLFGPILVLLDMKLLSCECIPVGLRVESPDGAALVASPFPPRESCVGYFAASLVTVKPSTKPKAYLSLYYRGLNDPAVST